MPQTIVRIARRPARAPWYKSPKTLRHAVMLFFFLFLLHVAYDHQVQGGGPRGSPSVEAYCPFGGLESLYQFLTTGGFIRRIEPSAVMLLAALLILTLIASRGFCGWICPFGSVQEWIGMLGRRLFKRRFNPTGAWDRGLRYFKYLVLAVIIALTWYSGTLVFRDYDPFLAFFHLGRGVNELPWAYAILAAVLAGSFVVERFFCKYACPLGAVLGILGRFGLTKIARSPADCQGCNLCQKKCYAHVDFLSAATIRDAECNHCMDCVVDCPKPGVLSVRGPKWRFSHAAYASLLVVGLWGLVGASKLAGKWQAKPEAPVFTDRSGRPAPGNIRGWMTLEEVAAGYGLPLERLYREAGLPPRVSGATRLNMVAKTYGLEFDTERLREAVAGMFAAKAAATPAGTARPEAPPKRPAEPKRQQTRQEPASDPEPEIRGFMTLDEISLKTGAPKEYVLDRLGLPESVDGRVPVREWMHDHGKSIQDLRDAVVQFRKQKR